MVRDTDADWNAIATNEPFFGVLANDQYRRHNLDERAVEEFYASGRADIEHVIAMLRRVTGEKVKPQLALDFGCGVGRLTFAMRDYARRAVGVDVADAMLDIARERAESRRLREIEFRSTLPDEPFDWVSSLIVFQHIPPQRGHELIEQLVERLAPGGLVSLQLTFFRDPNHRDELLRDIADYRYDGQRVELLSSPKPEVGAMSMYDYDLNRVFRTLYLGGVTSVLTEHTDHGGCHGTWLFGQKHT